MFSKATWILVVVMTLLTGTAIWAGHAGVGLEQPTKNPISIREQSVRGQTGRRPIRYFMLGGIHRGK